MHRDLYFICIFQYVLLIHTGMHYLSINNYACLINISTIVLYTIYV